MHLPDPLDHPPRPGDPDHHESQGRLSLLHLGVPPWELVIRSVAIYVALLVALRLFGKREVGQFTLYDLVLVLLVANAVQPAMTGPDSSLLGGLVIIATLVVANFLVGRLDAIGIFHRLVASDPTTIVKDGEYLEEPMSKEGLDREEVDMAIREHGIATVSEVALAVLETDGSISVVGKDGTKRPRRRPRRRYRPTR